MKERKKLFNQCGERSNVGLSVKECLKLLVTSWLLRFCLYFSMKKYVYHQLQQKESSNILVLYQLLRKKLQEKFIGLELQTDLQ